MTKLGQGTPIVYSLLANAALSATEEIGRPSRTAGSGRQRKFRESPFSTLKRHSSSSKAVSQKRTSGHRGDVACGSIVVPI